jgi:CO/xanthine dehydrogenase FAD-binding subunit
MRGDPRSMKVLSPKDEREALRLYKRNPDAMPLAGGTDVMVLWNAGRLNGKTVLDLSKLAAWSRIRETPKGVWIGALATHSAVREHPAIARRFPLLVEACATVGGLQIQNRGTIGGNIANASPAGDTFPPLYAYEALVHVVSDAGRRIVPIDEIFAGVKRTHLQKGELIEGVELCEPPTQPTRWSFRKVGTRAAQAISKTVFAGRLWLNPKDKVVDDVKMALGSVAPTAVRLQHVEMHLTGRKLDAKSIAGALKLLHRDISPIDDIRSTRDYRMTVSRNLVEAFLS